MISDAELLAELYDWHNELRLDRQRRDVAHWLRTLRPGRLALLGAGTGRVARPLAEAGFEVIAVDIDPARLARIPSLPTLRPLVADMRDLPPLAADAALAPYSAVQLLPTGDLPRFARSAFAALRAGGELWVDLSRSFATRGDTPDREVLRAHLPALGVDVIERQEARRMDDHLLLRSTWRVGADRIVTSLERWYFHPDETVRAALEAASFSEVAVSDGYGCAETAHRTVYRAVRP